jgi:AcrR family transcriptional regulator
MTHIEGAVRAQRHRRRDAAATRRALLTAARKLMAEHGVEGTSTREVATAAGVNQALVYRYFGSKENLFAAAVGDSSVLSDDAMSTTPLADLPRLLLDRALETTADGGQMGNLATLISGANDSTVRTVLRRQIDSAFSTRLAARLDGPDAGLRAEMVAALLVGIGVLRAKVGTRELSTTDREILAAYFDRAVRPLIAADPTPLDNPATDGSGVGGSRSA